MALTAEEIENTCSIISKFWGTQIASSININEDVVEVAGAAMDSAMKKSQLLFDMMKAFIETSITLVGSFGGKTLVKIFGRSIVREWPPLTEPLKAVMSTVAAQYRTGLMMAASGLGVWI